MQQEKQNLSIEYLKRAIEILDMGTTLTGQIKYDFLNQLRGYLEGGVEILKWNEKANQSFKSNVREETNDTIDKW